MPTTPNHSAHPSQPLTPPYNLLQVEKEYNPLELLLRGKGVVRVHVHGGSNLKPMDDTTKVLLLLPTRQITEVVSRNFIMTTSYLRLTRTASATIATRT